MTATGIVESPPCEPCGCWEKNDVLKIVARTDTTSGWLGGRVLAGGCCERCSWSRRRIPYMSFTPAL
jgi:hypothetical protein